jgi:hypothetical protein
VYRVFSGIGCRGNEKGRWCVLNTVVQVYVLCEEVGVFLCVYLYSFGGAVLRKSNMYSKLLLLSALNIQPVALLLVMKCQMRVILVH